MCDHILHAKFKMLISITSIKKQTSLIKEKSMGGGHSCNEKEHITEDIDI